MAELTIFTVDLGATNSRYALDGGIESRIEACSTPVDYQTAIITMAKTAGLLLDGRAPDGVGISIAGRVDDDGVLVQAGQLAEYGWVGNSVAEDVAQELQVPRDRVVVLNDCAAGATSELKERTKNGLTTGAFMVLSTGFGGARWNSDGVYPDEPGHEYLRPGAICGDGKEGHIEAHISGSGIERRRGVRAENIPHDSYIWQQVKRDFTDGMKLTLDRYKREFDELLEVIGFTGSVAVHGPRMLEDLREDLHKQYGDKAPDIELAVHGEQSGLYGGVFAVRDLLQTA